MTGEKNRAQNCLTVSNFKLDDVFSNVFGKSASAITTQLLEHPGEQFDVAPFVDGRCKTPIAQIQEAVDGIFTYEQAEKLKIIRGHMDSLERHRAELESCPLPAKIDRKRLKNGMNHRYTRSCSFTQLPNREDAFQSRGGEPAQGRMGPDGVVNASM